LLFNQLAREGLELLIFYAVQECLSTVALSF
jgi:hypothetical protein